MITTLLELQTQVSEWSHRNFPNNKPHHPLLGIVEEVGELDDATTDEAIEDAVADILIYAADYCARNDLLLVEGEGESNSLGSAVSRLAHFHLKGEQDIRYPAEQIQALKQQAVERVAAELFNFGRDAGVDVLQAASAVWEKVRLRDWQKHPVNAAKIAEGSL